MVESNGRTAECRMALRALLLGNPVIVVKFREVAQEGLDSDIAKSKEERFPGETSANTSSAYKLEVNAEVPVREYHPKNSNVEVLQYVKLYQRTRGTGGISADCRFDASPMGLTRSLPFS
jgi:hypothetical protein